MDITAQHTSTSLLLFFGDVKELKSGGISFIAVGIGKAAFDYEYRFKDTDSDFNSSRRKEEGSIETPFTYYGWSYMSSNVLTSSYELGMECGVDIYNYARKHDGGLDINLELYIGVTLGLL